MPDSTPESPKQLWPTWVSLAAIRGKVVLPSFSIDSVPPLRTHDGEPVPNDVQLALFALLERIEVPVFRAKSALVLPPELSELRALVTERSQAQWARTVLSLYFDANAPREDAYVLSVIAVFPFDEVLHLAVTRPNGLKATKKPKGDAAKKGPDRYGPEPPESVGMRVHNLLSRSPGETARFLLFEEGRSGRTLTLRESAVSCFRRDEREPALNTANALCDLIPRLSLDATGARGFAIHGGVHRVVVQGGAVTLIEPKGHPRRSIALSKDSNVIERDEFERMQLARELIESAIRSAVEMLEVSMIEGTVWPFATWVRGVVEHPIVRSIGQMMLWCTRASDGAVERCFRVAEDGTLANENDDTISLDTTSQIGLVHPLDLDDETRLRWAKVFDDYKLLQPVEQLHRWTMRVEDAGPISNVEVDALALGESLKNLGWDHYKTQNEEPFTLNALSDALHFTLHVKPGFSRYDAAPPPQRAERLEVEEMRYNRVNGVDLPGPTALQRARKYSERGRSIRLLIEKIAAKGPK